MTDASPPDAVVDVPARPAPATPAPRRFRARGKPWLLGAAAVGLGVAAAIDPLNLVWVALLLPVWVVAVPLVLPRAERRLGAGIDATLDRRRALRQVRAARPGDAVAGLSLAEPGEAGALSLPARDDAEV